MSPTHSRDLEFDQNKLKKRIKSCSRGAIVSTHLNKHLLLIDPLIVEFYIYRHFCRRIECCVGKFINRALLKEKFK